MKQKFSIWLFVAAVVIIPIGVFAVVRWLETAYQPLPVLGPENHTVSSFEFTSQYGKPVSSATWDDHIVVANLFFTHCPVVCPKLMFQLKRVQAYGDQDILINSITVDPERDDVARLKSYAGKFDIRNNWLLLTGGKIDIYRFARKELLIVATDGDGGPEDFIHSDNLVLIDRQGRIRGFYKGTDEQEVNKLVHDIKKLKRERK